MPTPVKTFLRLSSSSACIDPVVQDAALPPPPLPGSAAPPSMSSIPLQVLRIPKVSRQHDAALKRGRDEGPAAQDDWLFDEQPTLQRSTDVSHDSLMTSSSITIPAAPSPAQPIITMCATPCSAPTAVERPLDKYQMQCVVHDANGPLLIRAGAGSGKTQTISKRIAYLMIACGVPPYHILGLSFSRASAEELRHRVAATLPPDRAADASKLKMKTIHGFCLEMLRRYHEHGARMILFDDKQRRRVAERAVVALQATTAAGYNARDNKATRETVNKLLAAIDETKRTIPPDNAETWATLKSKYHSLTALFHKYQSILHDEEGACDFADLQFFLYRLLKDETKRDELQGRTVAEDIRRRFTHIIVDEVQDVDSVQYEILVRIAGDACRVSCVGDPRQSIYGFRGAVRDFFGTWTSRFSVKSDSQRELLSNYRSVSQVVEVGNLITANYAGNCSSVKGPGAFPVTIQYAVNVEDMSHKALDLIRRLTAHASGRGLNFSDFGIVARKSAPGRHLQQFLQQHGIPCRTLRRRDPTAAVMMRGLLAHLRCLIDPYSSNVAVMEALEYPEKLAKNTKTGLISGRKCRADKQRMVEGGGGGGSTKFVGYFELIEELVQNQFMVPDAQLIPRTRKDKEALSRWYEAVVCLHRELKRMSIPADVLQYSSQRVMSNGVVKQEDDHAGASFVGDPLKNLISRALQLFGFVVPQSVTAAPAPEPHAFIDADDPEEDEVDPIVDSADGLRDLLFEALDNLKATNEPHEGIAGLCALVDSLQPLDGTASDYGPVEGAARGPRENTAGQQLPSALQRQKSMQDNRITISTVHKAKGLEWPVVLVFDCTDGEMPIVSSYGDSYSPEEKRIFYVAVSRAMEQLVIFAQESPSRMPSRFLKCLEGYVEEIRAMPHHHSD